MTPVTPTSGRGLFLALALLGLIGLVYANGLNGSFHSDDYTVIQLNPRMEQGPAFFRFPPERRQWLEATFAWNYQAGGFEPFGYHLFNLGLHAGSTLLVGALVWITLRQGRQWEITATARVTAITAALFALHPVHTETVTYISGRSSGLSGFFYLAALLAFTVWSLRSQTGVARAGSFILMLVTGAGALLSKETSLTLPLAFLAYDYCFMRGEHWRALRERWIILYLPLALVALIALLVSDPLQDYFAGWLARIEWSRLPDQLPALAHALRMLVFPVNLTFDYDFPRASFLGSVSIAIALCLWILLAAMAWRARNQSPPVFTFAFLFFLIVLAPTNSVLPRIDLFSERNLYLPAFGVCWVAGLAVHRLWQRSGSFIVPAGLALWIACFGLLVPHRNAVYATDVSLWQDTLKKSPEKSEVHYYLALSYSLAGDTTAAQQELVLLKKKDPELVRTILQTAQPDAGQLEAYFQLLGELKRLVQSDPVQFTMYGKIYRELSGLLEGESRLYYTRLLLGTRAAAEGNVRLAEMEFLKARDTRPDFPEAYLNLGALTARLGRLNQAEHWLEEAGARLSLSPGLRSDWLWNYGQLLVARHRPEQARPLLEEYLANGGTQPEARLVLGIIEAQTNHPDQAVDHWLQLDGPASLQAQAQLQIALTRIGQKRWEEAQAALEQAVKLAPELPAARFNLAKLLLDTGGDSSRAQELLTGLLPEVEDPNQKRAVKSLLAQTQTEHDSH